MRVSHIDSGSLQNPLGARGRGGEGADGNAVGGGVLDRVVLDDGEVAWDMGGIVLIGVGVGVCVVASSWCIDSREACVDEPMVGKASTWKICNTIFELYA